MNKRFWIILEAIMLVIWIVTTVIFCIAAFSDGADCKANPLIYGVNYLSEENNDNLTCLCTFDSEPLFKIFVNKESWALQTVQEKPVRYELPVYDLNFSFDSEHP